jgi:bacillithiol biosynthesis cysteine-adding enzyme BshC
MEFDCLAPNEMPRITRLSSAYLSGAKKLSEFYPHPPTLAAISSVAREMKREQRYPSETRSEVADILTGQNKRIFADSLPPEVARNLESLREGAVAVVTGQQAGLFGGPAYTFYKALTAIRLVNELHQRGVEAVPIFWIASEDHDLAEVSHCDWLTSRGLERLTWPGNAVAWEGQSVGRVLLGDAISQISALAAESLEGPLADRLGRTIQAAYRPSETFASAFAKLLREVTGRFGLILLDPMDERLHRLAVPLLQRTAELQGAITPALIARSKRLEQAGFHAQVKVTESATLLFGTDDRRRTSIRRKGGEFILGETHLSDGALREKIAHDPLSFSPNALLRPVVQDTLLPTVAYVAGAAEVAYLAQSQVIYDRLGVAMPVIVPRASFTLLEPHVERLLSRYKIRIKDHVLRGGQILRQQIERNSLPKGLDERFSVSAAELQRLLISLRKPIQKLDPTLIGAAETAARKISYQLEKLRGKVARARDFREGVLSRHERIIHDNLFPGNHLQEREMSLLPFLAKHGVDLLETLARHAGVGAPAHQIVHL